MWMVAAALVGSVVAIGAGAPTAEVMWGMAGPLAGASVTWVFVHRTFRAEPVAVMQVLLRAFAGKTVFFAVFVVAMIKGLSLDVRSFALSFTAFFVGMYALEAHFLRRLFVGTR